MKREDLEVTLAFAAESGNKDALYRLGEIYAQGEGVPRDADKAREYFQKAAEAGEPRAMCEIALRISDEAQAFQWVQKASEVCQKENVDPSNAQFILGMMYRYGYGVDKDMGKAVELLQEAATAGHCEAMCMLGTMYRRGIGVQSNVQEAVAWLEKAAAKGDVGAMNTLGDMYAKGLGVAGNGVQAVSWYEKAAAKGNTYAMTTLGEMFEYGNLVKQDGLEAVRWYKEAANAGDCEAMITLGDMYRYGKTIEADAAQVMEWYERAANKGDVDVMSRLGDIYAKGCIVQENTERAAEWYGKAAEEGDYGALETLCDLDLIDIEEAVEQCKKFAEAHTGWVIRNKLETHFSMCQGQDIESLQSSNFWGQIRRSWEIADEVEAEQKEKTEDAFNRCQSIIGELTVTFAALYEEELGINEDTDEEEILEAYQDAAAASYIGAIENRIEEYEDKGDVTNAEALRDKMVSALEKVFGVEVPKKERKHAVWYCVEEWLKDTGRRM